MKAEFPRFSDVAIKTLLPFPSTYLSEVDLSTLTYLKGKCRNALNIHAPICASLVNAAFKSSKKIEMLIFATTHYNHRISLTP